MQSACDRLLSQLKNIDDTLGDVRLKHVYYTVSTNEIEVRCVSDVAVPVSGVEFIKKSIQDELPIGVKVAVKVEKAIVDAVTAKRSVLKYISDNHHSVAHTLTENSVKIICAGKITKYDVCLTPDIADYFTRFSVLEKTDDALSRQFSSDFSGSIRRVSQVEEMLPEYKVEVVYESDSEKQQARRLKVLDVTKFCDSEEYDTAYYIEDAKDMQGDVIFAGYVQKVERREAKNGRPFFVITIDDKTGTVSGKFFTGDQNKIKKIDKLSEGSIIIMRGVNELYNDRISLTIKGFNLCMLPEGYTPEEKPSKTAPENYTYVFPEKAEIIKQGDIFTKYEGPSQCLLDKEFTVVDIETTGLNVFEDKVIEIGAVKISNGEVVSSFQVLINPGIPISEKSVDLTGINDEMVADCHTIDEVYPDFFKYLGDSVFIAHNSDFDFRFLKNVGKKCGYVLNNDVIDTVALSREVLPGMKNYKLNTLCDRFGIVFRHHRALADAFATAELFLELIKIKKSL